MVLRVLTLMRNAIEQIEPCLLYTSACNRHHDGVGQILNHAENTAIPSLVGGIMSNLSGMFDSVNKQVADISVSYTHLDVYKRQVQAYPRRFAAASPVEAAANRLG